MNKKRIATPKPEALDNRIVELSQDMSNEFKVHLIGILTEARSRAEIDPKIVKWINDCPINKE